MASGTRPYAGRSAAERAAERRERLGDATVRLLARSGETATTMTAVCAEAGLTERYFYESFASRDDALAAALDHVAARIVAVAESAVSSTPGSPVDRAHGAIAAVVRLAGDEADTVRVAVVESSANARLRAVRRRQVQAFADVVQRHATDLFGPAAPPPARLRLHALLFIGGFTQLLESWLTGDLDTTPDELTEVAVDLFLGLSGGQG